jgi:microcystin-dependent protein
VAYAQTNDVNTGLYFPSSDHWGLVAGGTATLTSTSSAIAVNATLAGNGGTLAISGAMTVSSTLAVTGDITHHGQPIVPVGMVVEFAGTSAPNGWLLCFGQAISRTTYSALFTALGTTYGAGDGSTTFNLPDCRGRVTAGKDDMGGASANRLTNQSGGLNGDTLGATGGAETHMLSSTEMPSHTHTATVTDPGHVHLTGSQLHQWAGGPPSAAYNEFDTQANTHSTNSATTGITVSNSSTGGGGVHNNVQPTLILNKLIYAGVYS